MPKAGSIKRITNPDDASQYFDVRIVDKLDLKHGSGPGFQRRKMEFINHEENGRKVEPKVITHKAVDKDGNLPPEDPDDVDDPSQRVTVELIKEITTKHGSGPGFLRRIKKLDHDKETNGRKTHRVRLRKSFGWLDIERTDKFFLLHGSGPTFRREIISIEWNDEEFDGTTDIPLHVGPKDGFDSPWRLDPFQNIVNVKWREDDPGDPGPHEVTLRVLVGAVPGPYLGPGLPTLGRLDGPTDSVWVQAFRSALLIHPSVEVEASGFTRLHETWTHEGHPDYGTLYLLVEGSGSVNSFTAVADDFFWPDGRVAEGLMSVGSFTFTAPFPGEVPQTWEPLGYVSHDHNTGIGGSYAPYEIGIYFKWRRVDAP